RTGMRVLLGNVELLLVPEMDLSHPGRGILANFRNASAGLWRLHPLRAGTVHVEELFLAQRTTAGAGYSLIPRRWRSGCDKKLEGRRKIARSSVIAAH